MLARLTARGLPALLAIRLEVETCFFHCAKAFRRSRLWQPGDLAASACRSRSASSSLRASAAATSWRRKSTTRSKPTTARTSDGRGSTPAWVLYVAIAAVLVVLALLGAVLLKSRPFRNGDVFVASRLTRGNRIFPTQVGIGPTSVTQYKPQWFGRQEQSIHSSHVASVTIEPGSCSRSHHRDQRRLRADRLPRPHQGRRGADEGADREHAEPALAARGRRLGGNRNGSRTRGDQNLPFCAETIKLAAIVCRYCNRELPAA